MPQILLVVWPKRQGIFGQKAFYSYYIVQIVFTQRMANGRSRTVRYNFNRPLYK